MTGAMKDHKGSLGPPSALLPFFGWEGFPTKTDKKKKVGTLGPSDCQGPLRTITLVNFAWMLALQLFAN